MKKYIALRGMHCRSCEILVQQHLLEVAGVRHVEVSHTNGVARVTFADDAIVDEKAIERAIRNAGYTIGTTPTQPWIIRDSAAWTEAFFALCIVFVLYLGARLVGLSSLTTAVQSNVSVGIALMIGLTAGVSTCAALVGGLVLGYAARFAETHPSASLTERLTPHAFFHLGRIGGFVILGATIGALGAAVQPSSMTLGLMTMLVGIVMVSLGIKLTELFPRLAVALTLPVGIARALGITSTHAYSHWRAALTGMLTFFVPCGFTQAIQLAAIATADPLQAALMMGAFAVGTTPGLFGIATLSSIIRGATARFFFKIIGIIVLGLGLWNISNGFHLTGFVLPSGSATVTARGPLATLTNGVQTLTMTQGEIGYTPQHFTIRKGIPFIWTITSTSSYTCASQLAVPSLGIQKNLTLGTNTLSFTPTTTGTIAFSCSMGMFRGSITVIDN